MRPRFRDAVGSATLLVLAMGGVLMLLGASLAVVTAMVADHRSAQSAADLAALAAAQGVRAGADGCAEAARVATANAAELIGCSVTGGTVDVQVRVAGPRWLGQTADLLAHSRAGPPVGD
jgi:secretion/DNA translocation related TadE-like protein